MRKLKLNVDALAVESFDTPPAGGERGTVEALSFLTAEASPNAVDDGPVAGSAIGVIGADGEARWTELDYATGGRFDGKVEGVARGRRPGTLYVIVDRDDPHRPSELCEVELAGSWPG